MQHIEYTNSPTSSSCRSPNLSHATTPDLRGPVQCYKVRLISLLSKVKEKIKPQAPKVLIPRRKRRLRDMSSKLVETKKRRSNDSSTIEQFTQPLCLCSCLLNHLHFLAALSPSQVTSLALLSLHCFPPTSSSLRSDPKVLPHALPSASSLVP